MNRVFHKFGYFNESDHQGHFEKWMNVNPVIENQLSLSYVNAKGLSIGHIKSNENLNISRLSL